MENKTFYDLMDNYEFLIIYNKTNNNKEALNINSFYNRLQNHNNSSISKDKNFNYKEEIEIMYDVNLNKAVAKSYKKDQFFVDVKNNRYQIFHELKFKQAGIDGYTKIVFYLGEKYNKDEKKDLKINKKGGMKYDKNKPDWSLLELHVLEPMIKILTEGVIKYKRNNWKKLESYRIWRALIKHLKCWQSGETIDPESNKSHLAHAACNLYFLMYKEQTQNLKPKDIIEGEKNGNNENE